MTTSNFADSALQYAMNVSQRVVLIDGDHLAELMIELNVGVAVAETISVKRTDSDCFEDASSPLGSTGRATSPASGTPHTPCQPAVGSASTTTFL